MEDFRQDLFDAIQETRVAFAKRNLPLPVSITLDDPCGRVEYLLKQSLRIMDYTFDVTEAPDFTKGVKCLGMELKVKGDADAQD